MFKCLFKTEEGVKLCDRIKTVEYKAGWHRGGTGYIDGVHSSDSVFADTGVVKFVDEYGRSAIAFSYNTVCNDGKEGQYAATAFQRSIGDNSYWVYGGHYANSQVTRVGVIDNVSWLENLLSSGKEEFNTYRGESCQVSINHFDLEVSGQTIDAEGSGL